MTDDELKAYLRPALAVKEQAHRTDDDMLPLLIVRRPQGEHVVAGLAIEKRYWPTAFVQLARKNQAVCLIFVADARYRRYDPGEPVASETPLADPFATDTLLATAIEEDIVSQIIQPYHLDDAGQLVWDEPVITTSPDVSHSGVIIDALRAAMKESNASH